VFKCTFFTKKDAVVREMNEVVEPAAEVDSVADEVEKEVDLVGRPADDESAAYHQ